MTRSALFLALASLSAASLQAQDEPTIIFATTTSTYDTGLLDYLVPLYDVRVYYEAETAYLNLGAEHVRRRVALKQMSGLQRLCTRPNWIRVADASPAYGQPPELPTPQ